MPITTRSTSIDGPVGQPHPFDACAAVDAEHADAEPDVDAVVAVKVGDERPQARPEAAFERHRQRLDEHDLDSGSTAGGGNLCADEAGADDHDRRAPASMAGADGEAVVEAAEGEDAVEVVGAGQAPRCGAGGDDEPVVVDPLAASQQHLPGGEVEPGRGGAEAPVEFELGVDSVMSEMRSRPHFPARTCLDRGGRS